MFNLAKGWAQESYWRVGSLRYFGYKRQGQEGSDSVKLAVLHPQYATVSWADLFWSQEISGFYLSVFHGTCCFRCESCKPLDIDDLSRGAACSWCRRGQRVEAWKTWKTWKTWKFSSTCPPAVSCGCVEKQVQHLFQIGADIALPHMTEHLGFCEACLMTKSCVPAAGFAWTSTLQTHQLPLLSTIHSNSIPLSDDKFKKPNHSQDSRCFRNRRRANALNNI